MWLSATWPSPAAEIRLARHRRLGGATLTLTRDTASQKAGLITATALGAASDTRDHNGFGEIKSYAASFPGGTYSVSYDEPGTGARDKLGRIAQKTETIGGVTTVYEYGYACISRTA
jgi:hypothetical protein